MSILHRLLRSDRASSLQEYALIIAVVAIALIGTLSAYSSEVVDTFQDTGRAMVKDVVELPPDWPENQ